MYYKAEISLVVGLLIILFQRIDCSGNNLINYSNLAEPCRFYLDYTVGYALPIVHIEQI
jgi:hypothetical protein